MDKFYLESLSGAVSLIKPEALLILAACVFYAFAPFRKDEGLWGKLSFLLLLTACFMLTPAPEHFAGNGLFRADNMSLYARWIGLLSGIGLVLLSWGRVAKEYAGEYYATLLIAIAGTNLVAASNDLVSLFLALELISIPTYLLLYLLKSTMKSREATTKYFLLSIFSSALLLYGMSFFFGATGTTNLEGMRATLRTTPPSQFPEMLTLGLIFVAAGLGFRLTAAPFHFYAPDVYEGAPTLPVTLLSIIPKIAGLVGAYQLIQATLLVDHGLAESPIAQQTRDLFWIMALVSMVLGNVLGLLQNNIRRLMAYSGVAHAGYMLFGLGAAAAVPGGQSGDGISGLTAVFFYLAVYTIMTLGVFAVLRYLDAGQRPVESIDDLAGLGQTNPVLAFFLVVFLFSLTGLPPTVGFWGKLYLFLAGWNSDVHHYRVLAILMAITAAIGAWYYLKVIGVVYLRQAVKPLYPPIQPIAFLVIVTCGLLTLVSFVIPNWFMTPASQATKPPLLNVVKKAS
ncbi:MAG TPA: NADH-quinone oxidoreductase subunit N [Gemmatales bacterium]|nr:NADH-quinone oxidoreductase subunit N [Gemmatales bacterium]